MPIETSCPACGNRLRLGDEHAGKTGRCPVCRTEFPIPEASAAPPVAAPDQFQPQIQGAAFDPANPYASPAQASYQGQPAYAAPQTDSNSVAATILGVVSIVTGVVGFCCCLAIFVSFPAGLIGLILSFQISSDKRTVPMVLNIIGLVMPILWFIFMMVVSIAQNAAAPAPVFQAPQFKAPPPIQIPLEE